MSDPVLDFRNAEAFYQQCLLLAKAYCPDWSQYWPADLDAAAVDQDPGLVMLNLFSLLAKYIADIENQVPHQRRLSLYQFLNLQLLPPVAARTPLSFALRQGQPPRPVPAGSAVLDAATQRIRFQTDEPLLVVPADLGAALTVISAQDQCINALPLLDQGASVPIFTTAESDPAETPLGHWFLIGDDTLFKPSPALQGISITLTGVNLHPEYFEQWFDGALTPLTALVTGQADALHLNIDLLAMPQAAAVSIGTLQQSLYGADGGGGSDFTVDGEAAAQSQPDYWLAVKPAPQVRILTALARQLPVITGLKCVFTGNGIPPQQAACNQSLMDISNGGYPFGQTPAVNDSFYVRCDSIFAKTGAQVTLSFDLRPVAQAYPVRVVWQYWDGSQWTSFNDTAADVALYQFSDTTSNLQHNAPNGPTVIAFVCPAIPATTVAGTEGRWIRATLTEGGYGKLGGYSSDAVAKTIGAIPSDILTDAQKKAVTDHLTKQAGVSFSYRFDPTTYAPPFIVSLQVGYRQTARPNRFWSYNAFELTRFLFSPFKPVPDLYTGFFFGFDPAEFARYSLGCKLTLFFYLARERAEPDPALSWQYYDGSAWQALAVDDGTDGLSRSGIVSFTVPAAMAAAVLFSQTLFWFKINNPRPRHEVRLFGLYPNSAAASNTIGIDDEILGSSNEQPSQTFSLNYYPVLPGMTLEVIEPQGLEPKDAPLTVTPPDTDPGSPGQTARPWQQVDSFAFCGPSDRAFTLDTANGLISFGDGLNGMIPPAGHDNIIAAHYDYTQGMAGNVDAGTLTVLRPGIADITGVRNPKAALGGVDGDTSATIDECGPARVRAGNRAVEAADFATLAEAASPQVARAQALAKAPGARGPAVRVAILPRSAAPRPYAEPALINLVAAAVSSRCLAPLAAQLCVCEAGYLAIDVSAQITSSVAADQRLALQQAVADRLSQFLHPVFGGADGRGWAFGQTVRSATIAKMLRDDPAITAIPALSLNGRSFGDIPVAPGAVAAAGVMTVFVYGQGTIL